MTVFTFSIALILVTSIVHVVIALQKDHIKRTGGDSIVAVSYTHLTLPTILRV